MKYLAILLLLSTSAQGVEVTEMKKPEMCVFNKRPINCAYLWGLFIGCPECPWKLKRL